MCRGEPVRPGPRLGVEVPIPGNRPAHARISVLHPVDVAEVEQRRRDAGLHAGLRHRRDFAVCIGPRTEDADHIGMKRLDLLQDRREVDVTDRQQERLHDLAALRGDRWRKGSDGGFAEPGVGHESDPALAVLQLGDALRRRGAMAGASNE